MDKEVEILVKAALNGDKEAFGQIYDIFLEKIYRFAYYLVGDEDVAKDLTQDTFVKVWKSLGGFNRDKGSFQTFLYAVARNTVIDFQRRKKGISLNPELAETIKYEANFEEEYDKKRQDARIHKIIKSLKRDDRDIIVLRYFEDLPYEAISKIVGKKEGAIRVQVLRILRQLKEKMEGSHGN